MSCSVLHCYERFWHHCYATKTATSAYEREVVGKSVVLVILGLAVTRLPPASLPSVAPGWARS